MHITLFVRKFLSIFVYSAMNAGLEVYLKRMLADIGVASLSDIGTFYQKVHMAHLEKGDDLLMPPRVEIHFSTDVDEAHRLELLLATYAEMESIEAREMVQGGIRIILDALRDQGEYELKGIGTLTLDSDEGYRFAEIPPEWQLPLREHDEWDSTDTPDMQARMPAVSSAETISTMTQSGASFPKRSRGVGFKTVLLLMLLPVLGLFLVRYGPFTKHRSSLDLGVQVRMPSPRLDDSRSYAIEDVEDETPADIPEEESVSSLPDQVEDEDPFDGSIAEAETEPKDYANQNPIADGTTRGQDEAVDTELSTDEPTNLDMLITRGRSVPGTANARVSGPNYHLIFGSFKSETAAERYRESLESKRFDGVEVLFPAEGEEHFRVSVFQSRNRKAVEDFASRMSKLGWKTGWILAL